MRKPLALLSIVMIVSGCEFIKKNFPTLDVCATSLRVTAGVSQAIAASFDCSNVDAISNTLKKPVDQMQLCAENKKYAAFDICPQIAEAIVGVGVTGIPSEWGCKGGIAATSLSQVITIKCNEIISRSRSF